MVISPKISFIYIHCQGASNDLNLRVLGGGGGGVDNMPLIGLFSLLLKDFNT